MNIFKKSERRLQSTTVEALRETIVSSAMPIEVRQIAERELQLMAKISPASAEYSIGLTYLEYLLDLPWDSKTEFYPSLYFVVESLRSGDMPW